MPTSAVLAQLVTERLASRIWAHDTAAFADAASPAEQQAIGNRLGWLAAPEAMQARLEEVRACAADVHRDGLTDLYLLGMGGSSLCAEVLRDAVGTGARLTVLDTTDERAIQEATSALMPDRACFIVASKSGSTIEVTSLERHFRAVMAPAVGEHVGRHFLAITDPDTELAAHAARHGYRHTFINPADIGGRYSALSLFGLVPAALCGIDIDALLASGRSMAGRCHPDEAVNPGLALGTFMGDCARAGRDKLTLLLSPELRPLGPWIEQLVAESTGKRGRGVLPIVGEPFGEAADYGRDRAFVAIGPAAPEGERLAEELAAAGHPVFTIEATPRDLGAEFFRWEFATAVAGAVLGVNPFDEPDVRGAKARTQAQLETRRQQGAFRFDPPFESGARYSRRECAPAAGAAAGPGRYVAILDYLPADPGREAAIQRLRARLGARTRHASTYGVGPRYLHSTGQFHKGGPNTGVFLLVTSGDRTSTPIPEADYSFSVLKQAQAFGDFDALAAAGRHVIHYHFEEDRPADVAAELERAALQIG